jgi:hypothetical protein
VQSTCPATNLRGAADGVKPALLPARWAAHYFAVAPARLLERLVSPAVLPLHVLDAHVAPMLRCDVAVRALSSEACVSLNASDIHTAVCENVTNVNKF